MWTVKSFDRTGDRRSAAFSSEADAREYVRGLVSRGFTDDGWGWQATASGFNILLGWGVYA